MLFGPPPIPYRIGANAVLQTEAWTVTFGVLQAAETSPESKLFAATTLKGKVGASAILWVGQN